MRTKLVTLAAVGALTLGGAAVAGTALAATDDPTPTPGQTPSYGAPAPQQPSDVTSARTERLEEALAGLVKDGTLTQAQADKVASTLAASGGKGPRGDGRGPGPGDGMRGGLRGGLAAAAKALGLSETELMTQLRAGKSLADVAEDKGVAVDTVVDALVAEARQRLADAVTAGRLTQAQADERLEDVEARITERVDTARPGGPGRGAPPAPATPGA